MTRQEFNEQWQLARPKGWDNRTPRKELAYTLLRDAEGKVQSETHEVWRNKIRKMVEDIEKYKYSVAETKSREEVAEIQTAILRSLL